MYSDTTILVTGADLKDRETILHALGEDCHVMASQTADDALAHISNSVQLIISEAKSNQFNGIDLMRRWKLRRPETPFLMLIDQQDTALAIEAMKHGASDCVVKPIDSDDVRSIAQQLLKTQEFQAPTDRSPPGGPRHKVSIDIPPDTSLEDLERAAVEQALMQHHGNRTHAARMLGISVRTLQRKLKAWGMPLMSLPRPVLNHSFLVRSPGEAQHCYGTHVH